MTRERPCGISWTGWTLPLRRCWPWGMAAVIFPCSRAAGIGVAMGNATEAVKAGADFVTASCEADGVALAIEKFVLSEGETL